MCVCVCERERESERDREREIERERVYVCSVFHESNVLHEYVAMVRWLLSSDHISFFTNLISRYAMLATI